MNILAKLGLARLSTLRAALDRVRQLDKEVSDLSNTNAGLASELQSMVVRVEQTETRLQEMQTEQGKQKRGNDVLWRAITRSHRLHEAAEPGGIREALQR